MSPQLTYKLTNDTSVKVQTTKYLKSFLLTYKLTNVTSVKVQTLNIKSQRIQTHKYHLRYGFENSRPLLEYVISYMLISNIKYILRLG